MTLLLVVLGLALAAPDEEDFAEQAPPPSYDGAAATSVDDAVLESIEARLDALEQENARLDEELAAERRRGAARLEVGDGLRLRPRGFLDVGAFWAAGDGVAYVRDPGGRTSASLDAFPRLLPFPERGPPPVDEAAWVYTGDPWANPVNSQGDPAHLGHDRSVIKRFDPISKQGGASFLVNTVALGVDGSLGTAFTFTVLATIEPRDGELGAPGDVVSIPLAYLDYRPFEDLDLRFTVGKITSTFGREYREQFAPDRVGITPSLLARYTSGNPVGVKGRLLAFDGLVSIAAALTNGGMNSERFGLFVEDIDTNTLPTGSVRIASEGGLDALALRYEVGLSALVGAKDEQLDPTLLAWQAGVDAYLAIDDFALAFEYLRGEAPRDARGAGPLLSVDGAALTFTLQATNVVAVLARADARRAVMLTPPNLYVSDVARFTVGLRFDLGYHVAMKIEALHIVELFGPEIADDIVTSSAIVHF